MKKIKFTIGIVAVLSIGYLGSTWYIGNKIENEIDNTLSLISEKINGSKDMSKINITKSHYDKGLFSTKLHLTITESVDNQTDLENDKNILFSDDITIYHGPFPIVNIAKGDFTPQVAMIDYQMTEKAFPELWKWSNNQSFITGHANLSFQKEFSIYLKNNPIKINLVNHVFGENNLYLTEGECFFNVSKDFSTVSVNSHWDKLELTSEFRNLSLKLDQVSIKTEPESSHSSLNYVLELKNLYYSEENYDLIDRNYQYVTTYKKELNFQDVKAVRNGDFKKGILHNNLTINKVISQNFFNDNATAILNQILINQSVNQTDENYYDSIDFKIGSLTYGNQNLGSISSNNEFINMDGISMLSFVLGEFGFGIEFSDPYDVNPDKDNRSMSYKFNWHTDVGDINVDSLVDYTSHEDFRGLSLDDNINLFILKLDMPFNVINYIAAQFENYQQNVVTQEQIDKIVLGNDIKSWLDESILFTFEKNGMEGIYSDANYSSDTHQAEVNGKFYSEDDFFTHF
ncbi:DUF945 family protein [Gilliamella sp. B2717]|uniref:DUF945 family protein n=1 Tax=Gilliamella sp. B2717 TaxID=2817996 RepID=UPI002269B5F5|nr:DUF945 family protein [Gilliamella sp. B2717]MCX8578856.1 DUF945 family protein [Gilliamella sp. B2717]